jgi:hypothetical protein
MKDNVTQVDSSAVLDAIASLPISTWNYKAQDASIRHIGPMAQDFSAAFGVGEDDTHITTVDADGVALAGIQALYARNQQLETRVSELEKGSAIVSAGIPNLPWILTSALLVGIIIGQILPRKSKKQ